MSAAWEARDGGAHREVTSFVGLLRFFHFLIIVKYI